MANATEFGLAAYCYTQDLGCAWRMSEQLQYGMVGINKGLISNEGCTVWWNKTVRFRARRLKIWH